MEKTKKNSYKKNDRRKFFLFKGKHRINDKFLWNKIFLYFLFMTIVFLLSPLLSCALKILAKTFHRTPPHTPWYQILERLFLPGIFPYHQRTIPPTRNAVIEDDTVDQCSYQQYSLSKIRNDKYHS